MRTIPATESPSDARLVQLSRTGDREAFGRIVERYQSLICALTYTACGNLPASEDLAQVTFITAWCQLKTLREPAKLKAWLCRIARNVTTDSFRQQQRTPTAQAEALEESDNVPADTMTPRDKVISQEEQAILWRVLEGLPANYREPLVLSYRQEQSVAEVADALELSEDAVKQRLSRGRAMLTEQVAAFVEGALQQTTPGRAFTLGVLAALPAWTISAKAAIVGATAAKGSATAKAAAATGLFGAILSPILGFFGTWLGYQMGIDEARSDRERERIRSFYRRLVACVGGFFVIYALLMFWARRMLQTHSLLFVGLILGLVLAYVIAVGGQMIWWFRVKSKSADEPAMKGLATSPVRPAWEYRSRFNLLGLPFVHIRIGGGFVARLKPVKAWIAVGDSAIGVLCAFGGLAIGWQAFGGCAVAWNAAVGGVAVARDFALGGIVHAAQANNEIAGQAIRSNAFFQYGQIALRHLAWLNLLWLLPLIQWRRVVARRARQLSSAS
ncbi:MAG TPA: sigma-70 family RNA polymerase sigma factor [Verrucomicrobiae bacterium]|nr:sigma-70 family RNA polymerase sigma factor [Verrucomicrobiae bacterium]